MNSLLVVFLSYYIESGKFIPSWKLRLCKKKYCILLQAPALSLEANKRKQMRTIQVITINFQYMYKQINLFKYHSALCAMQRSAEVGLRYFTVITQMIVIFHMSMMLFI